MTSPIRFHDRKVQLNNAQFSRLLELALETAQTLNLTETNARYVNRIRAMDDQEEFWPGRGIWIEKDFPDLEARLTWCLIFAETATSIFRREVGNQDVTYWQANYIRLAGHVSELFFDAAKEIAPSVSLPVTRDAEDYRKVFEQAAPKTREPSAP